MGVCQWIFDTAEVSATHGDLRRLPLLTSRGQAARAPPRTFREPVAAYCDRASNAVALPMGTPRLEIAMTLRGVLLIVPFLMAAMTLSESRAADDHPAVALVKSKVKDPNKPFGLIVTIKVKAGKEKEFEEAFAPCIAATKKEPGCISYELNRDTDDPSIYVNYEKFRSVAALEEHLKQPHTQKLLATVPMLADGDLKIKVYTIPE